MKKQKRLFNYIIPIALVGFLLVGCQKVETTRINTNSNSESQSVIATDELTLNNEFDQAIDDAVAVICNPKATIPGAIVDTSRINVGVIEIDYYGKELDGTKSRTGSDSIHETMVSGKIVPWGTPGTIATITFGDIDNNGYEVMFLTNSTSVKFTGTAALTNVYGGYLQNITAGDSLVERIRASISFTYNDNVAVIQLFNWYLSQERTFTIYDTVMNAITRGDTNINGYLNVSTWGTTRFGNSFYTAITSPMVQNISDPHLSYNPLSGDKAIEGITEPILSSYGVSSVGLPQATGTPYGLIATWINNGGQAQAVLPYYY